MSYSKNKPSQAENRTAKNQPCNNIPIPVSGSEELKIIHAQELMDARPKFDQVQITLFSQNNPREKFTDKFGKPWFNKKRKLWQFPNGLCLSAMHVTFWYSLWFVPNEDLWHSLTQILEQWPNERESGEPIAFLKSVELTWDFPFPGLDYKEVESVLMQFANTAIPANRHAEYKPSIGKTFKKTSDGATNGQKTFYFNKLKRNQEGRLVNIPNSNWKGKMYAKQFNIDGVWRVRCEVTLQGESLDRIIGKKLPQNLSKLEKRLRWLSFGDFWKFEKFDYDGFFKTAIEYSIARKFNMSMSIKYRMVCFRHAPSLSQKKFAYKMARRIGSDSLTQRIGRKKFSKAVNPLLAALSHLSIKR